MPKSEDRFAVQIDNDGRQFIDMTPTWQEILPTWKFIVADATKTLKPDQMERFWQEISKMAEAADKWNLHCKLDREARARLEAQS